MEAFLDFVVKGLVDRPDAVTITTAERNGITVYELRVHPTDMGKIIGRQGATVNAIRALLLVGSAKRGIRCALDVVDEEGAAAGGDRPPRRDRGDRPSSRDRGPRRDNSDFRGSRSEPRDSGGHQPENTGSDQPQVQDERL